MTLRPLSFHIAASACLLAQQMPHFTVQEAIRAEWARQAPALREAERAKLSAEDRARLDLTLRRIGQPGAADLLPPELANPTAETWLHRAKAAKTPRERFDALFFLNRFKRPEALTALAGLRPEDAATWPKLLHLEAGIATARLNGAEMTPELQSFLEAMEKAAKVDPVRAQTARLRLVSAGKEKSLLPPLPATPGAVLAILDGLRSRKQIDQDPAFEAFMNDRWEGLGLRTPGKESMHPRFLAAVRSLDLNLSPQNASRLLDRAFTLRANQPAFYSPALLAHVAHLPKGERDEQLAIANTKTLDPLDVAALIPELRKTDPAHADALRSLALSSPHPIARAAAIEDLPSAPANLAALTKRVWSDAEFEPQQTLIQSYVRWKMPAEDQKAQLRPWLQHPEWACRWEAFQALKKLDPATPWPAAPAPTKEQESLLQEAERLAALGKPLRLSITFEGKRRITLRLDPKVAPVNVANLAHLARKGFFNGRRVPRVVPDFVVQMGSPYDTMDGGPGYTVRCEDSLEWFGPGSVGMALGGKDTGGSQFFITTNATPHLTGKYTRMGEVEDLDRAMPILDDLELGAKIERIEVLGE